MLHIDSGALEWPNRMVSSKSILFLSSFTLHDARGFTSVIAMKNLPVKVWRIPSNYSDHSDMFVSSRIRADRRVVLTHTRPFTIFRLHYLGRGKIGKRDVSGISRYNPLEPVEAIQQGFA